MLQHSLALTSETDPWTGRLQAGVDEVGIGPLAGPVVAAAVVLDPNRPIQGLNDSKVLTASKREVLAQLIKDQALCYAIGEASVDEIDQMNVLQASHLAMIRAVQRLSVSPQLVLVDGNKTPQLPVPSVAVVQGDRLVPQISAASIIAKVYRDRCMVELAEHLPGYGFDKHKGYPTKLHLQALAQLGVSAHHRKSFAPVQAELEQNRSAATTQPVAAPTQGILV